VAALIGAVGATALVFGLAQTRGRLPGNTLLLSGVVVAAVLASVVSILLFLSSAEDKLTAIVLWTMGGFSSAAWPLVAALTPVGLLGACALWAMGRDLDLLAFGEDPARFLGTDVDRVKKVILFLAALLTACAVAVSGVIGFVGLIVPHAMRRIVGPAHRALIPAAFLGGAIFLTLADLAARRLHPPTEIPVGLLTGILGGPFFLALLRAPQRRK
jgi:iron complex transport system permease protein